MANSIGQAPFLYEWRLRVTHKCDDSAEILITEEFRWKLWQKNNLNFPMSLKEFKRSEESLISMWWYFQNTNRRKNVLTSKVNCNLVIFLKNASSFLRLCTSTTKSCTICSIATRSQNITLKIPKEGKKVLPRLQKKAGRL